MRKRLLANVLWANVHLGKCIYGQMSSRQMSLWAKIVWANVNPDIEPEDSSVGFDSIRVFRINRLTINLREINRLIDYNRLIFDN
jgi:hypothetical protein